MSANASALAHGPATHTNWDYCEIGVLCLFILIGGPLNVRAFVRTLGDLGDGRKSLSRRFTLLRLNLIVADLMVVFVYAVSEVVWLGTFTWEGGDALCRVVKFAHMLTFMAVSGAVVSLSLDRVHTTRNLKSVQLRDGWTKRLLATVWTLVVASALPQLAVYETYQPYPPPYSSWTQCSNIWQIRTHTTLVEFQNHSDIQKAALLNETKQFLVSIEKQETIYAVISLVFLFWLPLLIIGVSYASVVVLLQSDIHGKEPTPIAAPSTVQLRSLADGLSAPESEGQRLLTTPSPAASFAAHSPTPSTTFTLGGEARSDYECYVARQRRNSRKSVSHTRLIRARNRTLKESAIFLATWLFTWSPYNVMAMWCLMDKTSAEALFSKYALLNNIIVFNAVINPLREFLPLARIWACTRRRERPARSPP